MEVRYIEVVGLRIELEQVMLGKREWSRARVVGGHDGMRAGRLPWAYAPQDAQALEDAARTWVRLALVDFS